MEFTPEGKWSMDAADLAAYELLMKYVVDELSLDRSLCLSSLKFFVRRAWPIVEPTTPLVWNWHLDKLCHVLVEVSNNNIKRLKINVPPGTGKSLLVGVLWPAWEWAHDPSLRYLTASYSDDNTIRDNRRLRSVIQSSWYRKLFPGVQLSSDQYAKIRYETTSKGWRIASSVGGVGTGEHPDRIIIDDPIKAKDARASSGKALDSCVDWYDGTISTRIARDPAIILVMQRLHQKDLSQHVEDKGGYYDVMFPMRFEPERKDPLDERTVDGELLWPELWPEAKVHQEEIDLGPFDAAGQLQQRPEPEGGGLFKRHYFEIVDAAPADIWWFRGWDTAGTERGGDWVVGVKLGIHESTGVTYIDHVARDQLDDIGVDRLIKNTASLDGVDCAIREEKDVGSAGMAVVKSRSRTVHGYDYKWESITGDKVVRCKPFRAQCQAGNVKLVRGDWNAPYIDVMCSFPVGTHDDDVDATSCAYNAAVSESLGPIGGVLFPKKH